MGCCGAATRVESARVNGKVLASPGLDTEFDGPRRDRSCRDVVFLVLLCAFCVGGIFYLSYAYSQGDVDRLVRGADADGNVCGRQNEQYCNNTRSGQNYSTMMFYDLPSMKCVKNCDSSYITAAYYCIPKIPLAEGTLDPFNVQGQMIKDASKDFETAWPQILLICLVGLVLSIIMIALLRFLAAIVVWVTVAIIVIASVAGTVYLWVLWHLARTDELDDEGSETMFLVFAIIATVFTLLLLILLIAMRKRIKLVIELFKQAGKAIADMPLMLLMPLWTVIALSVVCLVWVGGLVIIEAAAEPACSGTTVRFDPIPVIEYMRFYHIFGLFWLTQFVVACQHITVAGAVSHWYFRRDKSQLGWPLLTGFKYLVLYHLGSAALGSLIIAIVQMVRYLLKTLQKRLKPNGVLGCCLKCCQCCLACFEKFLKYLTRNAYIQIAIYGYGFCKSAQKAFAIITANVFRVTAINFVGDFVLFLAKLAILVSTGFIGYEIIKTKAGLNYQILPLLLALLFVWLIAHCFVSIYEMTIDTLFICFCEDCSMNDGISKPYFMNKGLMKFVENSKKALEQLEMTEQSKKNGNPWADTNVQQVGQCQIGASALPSQMPTPQHQPTGAGMSPLHPAYKPHSVPPSPGKAFPHISE